MTPPAAGNHPPLSSALFLSANAGQHSLTDAENTPPTALSCSTKSLFLSVLSLPAYPPGIGM